MYNSSYDSQLEKLSNLKWLPWVGDNYPELPPSNKILIIGESHYQNAQDDMSGQENKLYTRQVLHDMAIDGNQYNSPFFSNILKVFFPNKEITRDERYTFWNNLAFYNFVQRPMGDKRKRPDKKDFELGLCITVMLGQVGRMMLGHFPAAIIQDFC